MNGEVIRIKINDALGNGMTGNGMTGNGVNGNGINNGVEFECGLSQAEFQKMIDEIK